MDISIIDKGIHIRIAWIEVCLQCIDHGICMRVSARERQRVPHFSSRYSVRIAALVGECKVLLSPGPNVFFQHTLA